ncbi:MAG: hypothetical protein ABIY55_30290 [Kofleriaceae bacterium]
MRAKGTREQVRISRDPDPLIVRAHGTRDLERDPIEVLRMWPHSADAVEDPRTVSRATLPAPSVRHRLDDKIVLAHLALDLYRELAEVQADTRGTLPASRVPAVACQDARCQARTNALSGALIEACLLVQRVALMAPTASGKADVAECLRGLVALIDR